jgi:hypothetical protein
VLLDQFVCALSVKAATTKRAVLALCELGDGDNRRGEPTPSERPTWDVNPETGNFEPISVKKMFKEIEALFRP